MQKVCCRADVSLVVSRVMRKFWFSAGLSVQTLNGVVCSDLRPVFGWKVTVGQGFLNASLYFL